MMKMMVYPAPSTTTSSKTHFELFVSTRSRVIRVFNIPRGEFGTELLLSLSSDNGPLLTSSAVSLWTLREEWGGRPAGEEESVWVVFWFHEQALMALRMINGVNATAGRPLILSAMSALESDLEPSIKLRKVDPRRNTIPFHQAHSFDDLRTHDYNLSANPPPLSFNTPTTSCALNSNSNIAFRQADWMCICNAQNFMWNTLCIACNAPRHLLPQSASTSSRSIASASNVSNSNSLSINSNIKLPVIFTPSGRALAVGGKVQNISGDPMAPCIIFWPDNEPLPDRRQIRPAFQYGTLPGAQPPPILTTGNKDLIKQLPYGWTCGKCGYSNWRRRKVCQICYPYAKGNTDGASPVVQTERLAFLTQVLGICPQPTMQMQVQMSPAPSSSSTSTPTGSTHSARSSPSASTSILSVPSPKTNDTLGVLSLSASQHLRRQPYSHPNHNPLIAPLDEQEQGQKVIGNFSPFGITCKTTPNPNLAPTLGGMVAPATPPAVIHRQSPLTFTSGHYHLSFPASTTIWTPDEDELRTGLGIGPVLGLN